MPSIDDVLEALADDATAALAPYQPDLPPTYPNPALTAGTILPTLVAPGYPIQNSVMTRLENHLAQVAIYDMPDEKPFPYINPEIQEIGAASGTPPVAPTIVEQGRSLKRLVFEIWAPNIETRSPIVELLRSHYGDAFRIRSAVDQTVILLKYHQTVSRDEEQYHTVFVRKLIFVGDITSTILDTSTEVVATEQGLTVVLTPITQSTLTVDNL